MIAAAFYAIVHAWGWDIGVGFLLLTGLASGIVVASDSNPIAVVSVLVGTVAGLFSVIGLLINSYPL